MNQPTPVITEIQLIPLMLDHSEQFFDVVDDDDVRNYFEGFNDTKEAIIGGIPQITSKPEIQKHWLVTKNGIIVGYITLKRNVPLYRILNPEPEMDVNDPHYWDSLELSDEEQQIELQEKYQKDLLVAPYSVDIIIHRDHRGENLATQAFNLVWQHAQEMGVTEIYLEVKTDNEASNNWAKNQIGARLINTTTHIYYPANIYMYDQAASVIARKFKDVFRRLVDTFPELKSHKSILKDVLTEFWEAKAIVKVLPDINTCKFGQELDYQNPMFELKIGIAKRDDPITLIWSLYHEYGHLQQAKPTLEEMVNGSVAKYKREVDAWKIAEEKLIHYSYFEENQEKFYAYRDMVLKSYLPKDSVAN